MIQDVCWVKRLAGMSKPVSVDLRERVVGAVESDVSRRQAAEKFGGSPSNAVRWKKLKHVRGSVAPKAFVKLNHDATLEEICDALKAETGLKVAVSTLWRFFDRHAITLKKVGACCRARTA